MPSWTPGQYAECRRPAPRTEGRRTPGGKARTSDDQLHQAPRGGRGQTRGAELRRGVRADEAGGGGVPALEAELYDGTGSVVLVWLGRRRIAGIVPGCSIQVTGRVGRQDQTRVLYNPRYELIP